MSLTIAANRLTAILQQENAALTALDFQAATSFLEAKQAAISAFELARKSAAEPLRMDAVSRLRAASFANATLVERAIAVQRRVIEMVLAAVPKRDTAPRYRADAGMACARRTAPMTLLSSA